VASKRVPASDQKRCDQALAPPINSFAGTRALIKHKITRCFS
jgi:hypothetical protein